MFPYCFYASTPAPSEPSDPKERREEAVNHPKHYTFGKIEVIETIDDWKLGFYEGNIVKYVARAEHKGRKLEDLKKARWYLDRLIANLEAQK